MRKLYRGLVVISWLLGVVCLVAAVVLRFMPTVETRFDISARGGIFLAMALFLCALASRELDQAG